MHVFPIAAEARRERAPRLDKGRKILLDRPRQGADNARGGTVIAMPNFGRAGRRWTTGAD